MKVYCYSKFALVLHFCGVGSFAEWPAIAGPFTLSCCTIEIWVFIIYGIVAVLALLSVFLKK